MAEFIHNFHFIRPWILLFLLPMLLIFREISARHKMKSAWQKVCDKRLLNFLLVKGHSNRSRLSVFAALLGLSAAIIAAAGPSWKKTEIPSMQPQNPVMIVLNVSTGMLQQNPASNSLTRAKYKIDDLLALLKGQQSGLIVYTQEPFLITPVTDDANLIRNLLPEISTEIMPVNGERLDRAIRLACEKLEASGYGNGNIVLFTNSGGFDFSSALKAAETAAQKGCRVSAVNTGGKKSEQLELIVQKGRGIYRQISADDSDVSAIGKFISGQADKELKQAENYRTVWLDYGYYLIVLPLLCCLYFFRRGLTAVCFLLLSVQTAQAGFFLTGNQEGQRAFNRGDFQTAAQKFERADWKGSSLYKNGNYEEAYREFSKDDGIESLYNQGNALAKAGRIEEAVKKYEDVLKRNPQHEDAKFNLEYLKQQKPQQNNSNNSEADKNQNPKKEQQNTGGNGSENEKTQKQNQSERQNQDSDREEQQGGQNDRRKNDGSSQQTPGSEENSSEKSSPVPDKKENTPLPEASASGHDNGKDEVKTSSAEARPQTGKGEKYDERAQALEQQYREIPEDPGGLLRAYIYRDYLKNRYGD